MSSELMSSELMSGEVLSSEHFFFLEPLCWSLPVPLWRQLGVRMDPTRKSLAGLVDKLGVAVCVWGDSLQFFSLFMV